MRSNLFDYFDPLAEMRRASSALHEINAAREFLDACVGSDVLDSIAGSSLSAVDTGQLALDAIEEVVIGGSARAALAKQQEELEQLTNPLSRELERISAVVEPSLLRAAAEAERAFSNPFVQLVREEQERELERLSGNRAMAKLESTAAGYRSVISSAQEALWVERSRSVTEELSAYFSSAFDAGRELDRARASLLGSVSAFDAELAQQAQRIAGWGWTRSAMEGRFAQVSSAYDAGRELDGARVSLLGSLSAFDAETARQASHIAGWERSTTARPSARSRADRRARTQPAATGPSVPEATPIALPRNVLAYAPSCDEQYLFVLVRIGETMLRRHIALMIAANGFDANDVAMELEPEVRAEVERRAGADNRSPLSSVDVLLEYTDIFNLTQIMCSQKFWHLFGQAVGSRKRFRSVTFRLAKARNAVVHGRTLEDPRARVVAARAIVSELTMLLGIPVDIEQAFPDGDDPPTRLH